MSTAAQGVQPLGDTDEYCFHDEGGRGRKALTKWRLLNVAAGILPDDPRMQRCHTYLARGRLNVGVWVGQGRAWYTGLMRCGNVWACPVCSAKIAEGRKVEVQKAIDSAVCNGLGVSLVTLTVRHGLENPLPDLLEKFSKAQRRTKSGRAYKQLQADFGLIGEIRALEVTHGVNGWHPHTHAIMFSRYPLTGHALTQLRRRLFVLWYRACRKEGLPAPSYAHGADVRGARYAGEYVAKWGFATEISRPHLKKAKTSSSRTTWELLADAATGDKRAAWLFREFAQCFKGKRQLFWSRGLRDRLQVAEEQTDMALLDREPEEIALANINAKYMAAMIDLPTWNVVLRAGARGLVLEAALRSQEELRGLLNHLRCTVPLWNGKLLGECDAYAA